MSSINYKFKDNSLREEALTHPGTYHKLAKNYQRLEFLGDSVIRMCIADLVYRKFPEYEEGQLSIMAANLVNSKTLAEIATSLKLDEDLILDAGQEKTGGRQNRNILENVLEAYIGAIYIDSNFSTVQKIVHEIWIPLLDSTKLEEKDPKSKLQEYSQKLYKKTPNYIVLSTEGSAHEPEFTVEVRLNKLKASATGKNKKEAEHNAARKLLEEVEKNHI